MKKTVEKKWGKEEWYANTPHYCSKFLYVISGASCSLHYHKNKIEDFYLLSGCIRMEHNDGDVILYKDDSVHIEPYEKHRFTGINDMSIILETSTHHEDSDSYRIELSRGTDES